MGKTAAIWLIAICYLAQTVQIYQSDEGGTNAFFGNFGWHFEGEQ